MTRIGGGSTLEDLLWPGKEGTGGASYAAGTAPRGESRPGEGDLKVRSVMDPELFCRTSAPRLAGRPGTALLPTELTDPLLTIRFVCRLPTGSGVVTWDLNAAAAAAEESDGLDGALLRKADVAAIEAFELTLELFGCNQESSAILCMAEYGPVTVW